MALNRTLAKLLYGTGMRIIEGLQLRVKDIEFDRRAIIVREGKGGKDRVVMLPDSLVPTLREQLEHARALWANDVARGRAGVYMPDALERKYPRAGGSWSWFWVFPQATHSVDPRSGVVRRHHAPGRMWNSAALVAELDAVFASQSIAHWKQVLEGGRVIFSVV